MPKAVFLSYASQDGEAVGILCHALRQAGIEVWFDSQELQGGDAWDRKIRDQIRDCTLFIPVISANTQSRSEGYFRLEWKLAVDRSHLIADDKPFLLPVVLGNVPDAAARVPDRFRDVQWMRTPNGEPPAGFVARVQALLDDSAKSTEKAAGSSQRPTPSPRKSGLRRIAIGAGIAVVFIAAVFAFTRNRSAAVGDPVARARALYEPWDNATREDFRLAEDMLKAETVKDGQNAEAWAAYALVSFGQRVLGYDNSPERAELLRSASERAMRLDEKSFQARMARAVYLRTQGGESLPESEKLMRELVAEQPKNGFALRNLAGLLRTRGRGDPAVVAEAARLLDQAIAAGDAAASYSRFVLYWQAHQYDAAVQTVERGLAATPTPNLYRAKAMLATHYKGNLDEARAAVDKFTPDFLREDVGAYWATLVHLWRRDSAAALKVLGSFNRELIETVEFTGPKAYLAGEAHRIKGNAVAAAIEYGSALSVVDRRLAEQPNSVLWNKWKARIQARLGNAAETEAAYARLVQLGGQSVVNEDLTGAIVVLGHADELAAGFGATLNSVAPEIRPTVINHFRFSPELDPLRENESFKKFLAGLKP